MSQPGIQRHFKASPRPEPDDPDQEVISECRSFEEIRAERTATVARISSDYDTVAAAGSPEEEARCSYVQQQVVRWLARPRHCHLVGPVILARSNPQHDPQLAMSNANIHICAKGDH